MFNEIIVIPFFKLNEFTKSSLRRKSTISISDSTPK